MAQSDHVYWFSTVDKHDSSLVGSKGVHLGEMAQAGFPLPNGFIVSSRAYFNFIRENQLAVKIKNLLTTANFNHPESLQQVSHYIKNLILQADQSDAFVKEVTSAYTTLSGFFKESLVVVNASITAADLPTVTYFGQQEISMLAKGDADILLKIKECWTTLFEPQALLYRHEHNFDHFRIGCAVVIQQVIDAEQSGVLFTIDPVTNDKSRMIIDAVYGINEREITPDHYEINKADGQILKKNIVAQGAYIKKTGMKEKEVELDNVTGNRQKISDFQIKELVQLGKGVEKECYFPQQISWAIRNNNIYLTKIQALTELGIEKKRAIKVRAVQKDTLLTGAPSVPGVASGPARIILLPSDLGKVLPGDILVTHQTTPAFLPVLKKASAIISEIDGKMSHAAVVSRELGIPAIVGVENATKLLKNNVVITVNGSLGEIYMGGHIQAGNAHTHQLDNRLKKTVTKVYVNLVDPTAAERIAQGNVDGIGLLRAEPMIASIGEHPKKMIRDGRKNEFVYHLAEHLEVFCTAFTPRPVMYRTSDFTTNEYRTLIGGKDFEAGEANPFLGYRGAFRYVHDPEVFELELEAIKLVRNKRGLKNLSLMLPFVRNIRELIDVKKIISAAGLYRSPTFKLHMMIDTPSNVLLLDDFIQVGIDGVSIDSDDLAMLLLGIDRNNSEVVHDFDEQNGAVLWALEKVIKTAQKHNISSSICGQAPSIYPNILEKLVKWGITSVSVPPNKIETVREHIAQVEKTL